MTTKIELALNQTTQSMVPGGNHQSLCPHMYDEVGGGVSPHRKLGIFEINNFDPTYIMSFKFVVK